MTYATSNPNRTRRIKMSAFFTCVGAGAIALAASGCTADQVPQGELILAVQTDMSLPKDVDEVRIEVTSFGNIIFKNRYPVGAGGLRIPATLGILPGSNARSLVTIRVIASQRGKARMLREVVTTVPTSRLATLRLPIQWLSDGSAKVQDASTTDDGGVEGGTKLRSLHPLAGGTGEEVIVSTCPPEQTNIAGVCVDWNVDSETLPDYKVEDVFGGAKEDGAGGACFDTVGCMQNAVTVRPDASCVITPPAGAAGQVNVALRLPLGSDGICDDYDCFIPLDSAPVAGWTGSSGDTPAAESDAGVAVGGLLKSIQLPAAICQKIAAGLPARVVVSTGCATKLPSNPTCGPWSSVAGSGGTSGGTPQDGGLADDGGLIEPDAEPTDDGGTITDAGSDVTNVTRLVIAPANSTVAQGAGVQFLAFIDDGKTTTPTAALWSIDDPSEGAIDAKSGAFIASNQPGSTIIRAKLASLPLTAGTTISILPSTTTDAGFDASTDASPFDAAPPTDAGAPVDASADTSTTPFCSSVSCSSNDAGPGCSCSGTCSPQNISMFCDGTKCGCSNGATFSQQVTTCDPLSQQSNFYAFCLGQ